VGRDEQLEAFVEGLEEGPGSPGRAILFSGQRGAGKTVMLNALEDAARARGWEVVSETTRPGVAEEMASTSLPALMRHYPGAYESFVSGSSFSVAGFGAGLSRDRDERFPVQPSLRSTLTALTDVLGQDDRGVFITLDEVGTDGLSDLQVITQVVQHCFREGRPVMFAAAGLPSQVRDLLQAPGTTFLRRAERSHLGAVDPDDVGRAIAEPMAHAGRRLTQAALAAAVDGTQGYPFMVQLIGFQMWRLSRGQDLVDLDVALEAVEAAGRRVGRLVHEPALAPLSAVDRTFLQAMAVDDGPSRIADVAARLQVDGNYASQYRLRLIDAEIIHAPSRGYVDFSLPYLRGYLRSHAVHDIVSSRGSVPAAWLPPSIDRLATSRNEEQRRAAAQQPPSGTGMER